MKRTLGIAICTLSLLSPGVHAQGKAAANPLVGTWRVTDASPAKGTPNKNPHPGIYIFTPKHYSMVRITGTRPMADYPSPDKASDADKVATFDALLAQSGSYTVKGDVFSGKALVAKNPFVMKGPGVQFKFKVEKNVLTISSMEGGPAALQGTLRLVRVE